MEHLDEEERLSKSSSALLLSGVSSFGATYEYQFQPETPLSTHEAPAGTQVVTVLSCISGKTQDAQAQLGGFYSLGVVLHSRLHGC